MNYSDSNFNVGQMRHRELEETYGSRFEGERPISSKKAKVRFGTLLGAAGTLLILLIALQAIVF